MIERGCSKARRRVFPAVKHLSVKLWICVLLLLIPNLAHAGNWGEDWGMMTWSLPLVVPSTPQITNTGYGNEEIYLTVSDSGGSLIARYTATCTDGTSQYTGTSSTARITISGLTNGVSYRCSVTATNAAGTSAPSTSSPPITPDPAPAATPVPTSPLWLLGMMAGLLSLVAVTKLRKA